MAGKGRGVAAFTFNIDALGIGRGNMPEARVGPSPLFPTTEFKALPLKTGEEEDYMLALKQELRGAMQQLPHYVKSQSKTSEVEKYTERYLKKTQEHDEWTPDWNIFPKELTPQSKKRRVKKATKLKPAKKPQPDKTDVLNKLDELAKKDENPEKSDEETEKKKEEDEEEIEAEEYEEEDIEEENDYIESYFDNGEDFAADSDDNMDAEATY